MNAPGMMGWLALTSLLAFNGMASGNVEIIAGGSSLHSANGFSFDGKDRLYVASGPGSQLVVMDRHGKVLERFENTDGVNGSDDVAVAPDGSVYWTEPFGGTVKKLTTSGTIVSVAQLPPGANGITISPDGRIYVNTTILSDTQTSCVRSSISRTSRSASISTPPAELLFRYARVEEREFGAHI